MIETEPEDFFFDYYGNVSLKDNFTIYFNSVVYSYSVDMAMDLLQQVNRNIAITKLQYPELSGLNVKFVINSPGGEIIQGLRLFDAIKNNSYPVTTIASGEAASMGVILLVAGKTVKASENTTLLIHQLSAGVGGKHSVMKDYMNFYDQLQNKLTSLLVENSNAKKEEITNFMKGESFILAPEAKKLGIIDEVIPTI